jgi:putative transposase
MPRRARRSYPTKDATDLTDAQWAAIAPLVVTPSPNGGRPTDIDRRAIVNALLDNHRTGCQWRMLPKDFPLMSAVRYYFDTWNRDGTFVKMNDMLRKLARQALNRDPEPSISVLDSQSVKTTEAGGERGYDGEKKVNGRKRQFWVDTNGFLLRVLVHPADISDTESAEWLLDAHHQSFPRMQEIRVDEGHKQGVNEWMQQNTTIRLNVIEKPPGQKGFAVIPKRWVVKHPIAWAGRHRLARKESNRNPESSEAFLYLGSIAMLLNWLYPRCSFFITLSRRRKRRKTGIFHPFASVSNMLSAISSGIGSFTTLSTSVVPNFGIWSWKHVAGCITSEFG